MFFLFRSAACITAVVLALPGGTPSREAVLRSGTAAAGDLCRAEARGCAALLQGGVAAALAVPIAARVRPSFDTLRADDVRYAWAGTGEARPQRRASLRAAAGS